MELIGQLSNVNPSNPAGDIAAAGGTNKALWDSIAAAQGGAGAVSSAANNATGGWSGTIGDYMDKVAATPGVGAIIPGAEGGAVGRDMALRNPWLQPALDPNVMQVLKARPELMEWYKGADATRKKDIIDFISRNFVTPGR